MDKIPPTDAAGKGCPLPWTERTALCFVTARDFTALDGCTDDEVPAVLALAASEAPNGRRS